MKPLLLGVGERRETKDLGPGGSPGKNRPRALRGLRGPFDGQKLASEIEIFIILSMVGSPERKRTKQGESDGRYKEGEKHGETRAMQFAWLEQKDRPPKYTQRVCHWRENSLRAAIGCKMEV